MTALGGDAMITFLKLMVRDWRRQGAVICVYMAAPALLLLAALIQPWVAFGVLSRDPLVVAETEAQCCRFYYGALSNLGVLLWALAAGAALAAGVALRRAARRNNAAPDPAPDVAAARRARFFIAAGLLSLLLAGDDLFTIHEGAEIVFAGGEELVLGVYALLAAAFIWLFRRELLTDCPLFFMLAGALLTLSVAADVVFGEAAGFAFEDGAKFLGIAAWSGYFLRRAGLEAAG